MVSRCFFAAIALAGVLGLQHVAELWDSGAFAVVTLELPPDSSAEQRDAAIEVMRRTVGVAGVERLDAGEVAALLQPWLGVDNVPADLPLPILIDVRITPGATVDWDEAIARLAAAVPEAVLDTGMAWVERLVDLARVGQFLALLVLCFVTGIAVLTVVFATRAGLAIHQETIELLHLLGASDSYLAREFQWQALWLGLRGGIFWRGPGDHRHGACRSCGGAAGGAVTAGARSRRRGMGRVRGLTGYQRSPRHVHRALHRAAGTRSGDIEGFA